jgi:hypothetical protein
MHDLKEPVDQPLFYRFERAIPYKVHDIDSRRDPRQAWILVF